jgi:hypothetical protein
MVLGVLVTDARHVLQCLVERQLAHIAASPRYRRTDGVQVEHYLSSVDIALALFPASTSA